MQRARENQRNSVVNKTDMNHNVYGYLNESFLPKTNESTFSTSNPQLRSLTVNAKYFEIEKYFPVGSKASVIIHQKLYAQPIKSMDLLEKHV